MNVRPDARYCDNCGAALTSYSGDYTTHEERAEFDRNVALLFNITGIGAIVVALVGGFAFLSLMSMMPGIEVFAALAIIGGLAVGGLFLYLAYRIKEKG